MHFIAYLYERIRDSGNPKPTLRGHDPRTWVSTDYQLDNITLPVNQLAYSPCPTSRDLYFERVEGIPRPETWPRAIGRAVDSLYKRIHDDARDYCHATEARQFRLVDHFSETAQQLVQLVIRAKVRNTADIKPQPPSEAEQTELETFLNKIVHFEARIIASVVEKELARLPSQRPGEIFDQHFDFNVQFSIESRKQGLTSPATPDFFYHQSIPGDIKVGAWKYYYEFTMVAYALALEEEQGRDIDQAAILLVDAKPDRPNPSHHGSKIEFLDDGRRKRYIAVRDRKLRIIAEKQDPGRAANQSDCDRECAYWERCWGNSADA